MNKKNRAKVCADNLDKIDFSMNSRLNTVKLNSNNTWEHEMTKARICYEAAKKGFIFITEARFKNKSGIADVYLPEVDMVYEVLKSETQERFEKKEYPVKKIIPVNAGETVEV